MTSILFFSVLTAGGQGRRFHEFPQKAGGLPTPPFLHLVHTLESFQ